MSFKTYDAMTVHDSGVFLVNELERLDPELHKPLALVTWGRDIDLRDDVTIADEVSSFTNTEFAAMGGANSGGKNWISTKTGDVASINVKISKTSSPMSLWGMESAWSIPELVRAQQLGRPLDRDKHEGIQLKYNMDMDEQVYIGDDGLGVFGLVNNPGIAPIGTSGEWTDTTTAKQMLSDINDVIHEAWRRSGFAVCPSHLLMPPEKLGMMVQPVSDAGSESVLEYVARKCLSNSQNGRPLVIRPLKWLAERGTAGKDRMVAYSKDKRYVRFPMVPLQRTPVEHRGIHQVTTHFGSVGAVEFVYPETVSYVDGL